MPSPSAQRAADPTGAPYLERLTGEVIAPGLCVACGACLGLCPHLIFHDGRVAAPDACGLAEGRCYDLCPQAGPGPAAKLNAVLAGRGLKTEGPLGPVLEITAARAVRDQVRDAAQYGGVVSTLMSLALAEGLIEGAVLTRGGSQGSPQGFLAQSAAEVMSAAGSIYSAGAALGVLNRELAAAPDSDSPLGVVALPCQSLASALMTGHPRHPAAARRLKLVVGLFCTLNLSARGLRRVLQMEGVRGSVQRADFPPPPAGVMQIRTDREERDLPLEIIYPITLPGCALCPDLTAQAADISVGALEGDPGWNTILARTPAGAGLLDLARQKGLLEFRPLPEASLEHLTTAARNKRARADKAWKERGNV